MCSWMQVLARHWCHRHDPRASIPFFQNLWRNNYRLAHFLAPSHGSMVQPSIPTILPHHSTTYSSTIHPPLSLKKKKNYSLPTVEMHGRTNLGSITIFCLLFGWRNRLWMPLALRQKLTHITLISISTFVEILLLCLFLIHSLDLSSLASTSHSLHLTLLSLLFILFYFCLKAQHDRRVSTHAPSS